MSDFQSGDFASLYAQFHSPITGLDCGKRCAPYNENGIPFCCDIRHAVPSAYEAEWEYLQANSSLWRLWEAYSLDESACQGETFRLRAQTPAGQVLIACLGHTRCQRNFRSLTCRSFPFFPYLDRGGKFLGLSYYWEYKERCWVINHLQQVTDRYRQEYISTYDLLFERAPQERENFRHHSAVTRRIYGRQRCAIPLLHRNGKTYKITPSNGRLRRVPPHSLPRYDPYRIADDLPFPDE